MSAPRLNTIDGNALGEKLVGAVDVGLRSVGLHDLKGRIAAQILVVRAVDELVRYAQGNGKLTATDVDDHMLKLMPLLEHPLGSSLPPIIRSVLYDAIDPDTLKINVLDELALVIAAALGRQALDGEKDIRTSWLAAFGSMSMKTVERAKLKPIRTGLKGWTTTKEARSWLAIRNELS